MQESLEQAFTPETADDSPSAGLRFGLFSLPEAEWRDVEGYEGFYEVNRGGQVRRSSTGHILATSLNPDNGYLQVSLSRPGCKNRKVRLHVIVARAFLGPPPSGHVVNHIDGCKTNPRAENLEYVTLKENSQHALRLGLIPVGTDRHCVKLTVAQVREVFRLRAAGWTLRQIGAHFGVYHTPIRKILIGKTWKHLSSLPTPAGEERGR